MRVSLKWLADYIDITLTPQELAHRLTMAGLEVEALETTGGDWEGVSVASVLAVEPHPNADRLRLVTADLGGEQMRVVCGAPNVAVGQKVAFARAGATLVDDKGKPAVLKPATIRGVESAGMVCSERELGLSEEHEGILVLPDDAAVGTPLAAFLGDTVLHLDVKPNRADCLSMLGVAREVAALTGGHVREPAHTYEENERPAAERIAVEIADPDLCARYAAAVIEGVKIGPSPSWLQQRLLAAGQRPINNVVDITNYVMLEMGQPLHAFDCDRVGGAKIIVRRARRGERLRTLDGVERELSPDRLVIADAERPVALAGVMGGADSEISDATTTILLESANFDRVSIRRTAAALKLKSEASSRFEKGLPPELAPLAARRATKLMVELAGGRALHGLVDAYPRPAAEVHVNVARARIERVLGIDPPPSQVRQVLTSLGFGCRWQPPDHYEVRVPYWRTDVRIPDDVVEEVARITGYDEIPVAPPRGAIPPSQPQPLRRLRERVRDLLAAAGMQEVMTYPLSTLETLGRVMGPVAKGELTPLRLANPMTAEAEYLRPTLRASLLRTLAANQRREVSGGGPVALFEVARVFYPRDAELPREEERVAGAIAGRRLDRWGHPTEETLDFFDAKGAMESVFEALGVAGSFETADDFGLTPGRTARVSAGGQAIGVLGQVGPDLCRYFDLDGEVYLFDLSIDDLLTALEATGGRKYEPVGRFPAVVEDLALVVDESLAAARVREIIEAAPLVRSAHLFDVYTGPPVPAGKRSLAFSVTYQSPDHTLTDQEVARARERTVQRLKKEVGATLRE